MLLAKTVFDINYIDEHISVCRMSRWILEEKIRLITTQANAEYEFSVSLKNLKEITQFTNTDGVLYYFLSKLLDEKDPMDCEVIGDLFRCLMYINIRKEFDGRYRDPTYETKISDYIFKFSELNLVSIEFDNAELLLKFDPLNKDFEKFEKILRELRKVCRGTFFNNLVDGLVSPIIDDAKKEVNFVTLKYFIQKLTELDMLGKLNMYAVGETYKYFCQAIVIILMNVIVVPNYPESNAKSYLVDFQ